MPSFEDYPDTTSIKMLYMGNSGAGKTGSLLSLAAAGYNVRLLDLDNKARIIKDYLLNPNSMYRKPFPGLWTKEQAETASSRFKYVTITEGYNIQGSKAIPRGDSWFKISQQLDDWRDGDDRPGNIGKWGPQDILVIDSLSRFSEAAMNFQLSMVGGLAEGPRAQNRQRGNDYTAAYKYIMDAGHLIKSDEVKCHVILICHIAYMATEGDTSKTLKGFPQIIGRANISPVFPQMFQHVILAQSTGDYPNVRREIFTNNHDKVELLNPAPLRVKDRYPLETGLAEYFRDIQQGGGFK